MRRKEFAMTAENAEELLKHGEYGVLSTADKNGVPYGVPLNYAYDGKKIYFHCAPEVGRKLENIADNSNVCFTVVGKVERVPEKFSTRYESVIVGGTATVAEEKEYALALLIEKYSPDFAEAGAKYIERAAYKTAVYAITVSELSGKSRF